MNEIYYFIARGFVEPEDIVIDAGCGSGYGTEILSRVAKKVIGIDRSEEVIQYATKSYKCDNNYFMASNIDQMESFPKCDVIVCIDILKYLRFYKSFIGKIQLTTRKKIFIATDIAKDEILELFNGSDWELLDYIFQGKSYMFAVFYNKNG